MEFTVFCGCHEAQTIISSRCLLQKHSATLPGGFCGQPTAFVLAAVVGLAKQSKQAAPAFSVQESLISFQQASVTSGVRHAGLGGVGGAGPGGVGAGGTGLGGLGDGGLGGSFGNRSPNDLTLRTCLPWSSYTMSVVL
jgi:hypothetical protein